MSIRRTAMWHTAVVVVVILMPVLVFAAGIPDQIVPKTCTGVNCSVCDIATLAQNVLNTGIFLAVFLSAILFAWAGVKFLTNQSNPGGISEAKKIFWNVMVGLILILAAWLLVDTIMATFTGKHIWNNLC